MNISARLVNLYVLQLACPNAPIYRKMMAETEEQRRFIALGHVIPAGLDIHGMGERNRGDEEQQDEQDA